MGSTAGRDLITPSAVSLNDLPRLPNVCVRGLDSATGIELNSPSALSLNDLPKLSIESDGSVGSSRAALL